MEKREAEGQAQGEFESEAAIQSPVDGPLPGADALQKAFYVVIGMVLIFFCGYGWGKHSVDQWYAQRDAKMIQRIGRSVPGGETMFVYSDAAGCVRVIEFPGPYKTP